MQFYILTYSSLYFDLLQAIFDLLHVKRKIFDSLRFAAEGDLYFCVRGSHVSCYSGGLSLSRCITVSVARRPVEKNTRPTTSYSFLGRRF